jgi:hypothetical protein
MTLRSSSLKMMKKLSLSLCFVAFLVLFTTTLSQGVDAQNAAYIRLINAQLDSLY